MSPTKKRKISPTKSHSSKILKPNSPRKQNDETLAILFDAIHKILGELYFNPRERLQLDVQPNCIKNLQFCGHNHFKNEKNPNEVDQSFVAHAKQFITNHHLVLFTRFVSNLLIMNRFPGDEIISMMIEMILSVNKVSHKLYTPEYLIHESVLLFHSILFNFPPCWKSVNKSYRKFLISPLKIKTEITDYAFESGIFDATINMLEHLLQENETKERFPFSNSNNSSSMLNETSGMGNFFLWEARQEQKFNYDEMHRDDKMQRLFVVVELLVTLMENDLAMWNICYSTNKMKNIQKLQKMPLIGFVLWHSTVIMGQITKQIKKILKLFICCIAIGMPQQYIDIISRLVNLIAMIINMCELSTTELEDFPNVEKLTKDLATEIFKTIDEIQSNNVNLYLDVCDNIRTPFIKFIIIDRMISKFDQTTRNPSMEKIYRNFYTKRWLECSTDGQRQTNLYKNRPNNHTIYPVYDSKIMQKIKSHNEIYANDYIKLMLNYYRAYDDVYRINDIYKSMNKEADKCPAPSTNNNATKRDEKKWQKRMEREIKKQNEYKTKKFDFEKLENSLPRIEASILKCGAKIPITENQSVPPPQKLHFDGIMVDQSITIQYRNDLKYFMLLKQLIYDYHEEHGKIFDEWIKILDGK